MDNEKLADIIHQGGADELIPGITPAHAGKSFLFVLLFAKQKDHPRTCGEKFFQDFPLYLC